MPGIAKAFAWVGMPLRFLRMWVDPGRTCEDRYQAPKDALLPQFADPIPQSWPIGNILQARFAKAQKPNIGVAFDIDGVLIKGKRSLPAGQRAIAMLKERNIPFIFLTNGGGVTEAAKAEQLEKLLGSTFDPKQVVLSHSPMHTLVEKYADRPVLLLGRDSCKEAALKYGFRKPVLANEFVAWNPSMSPFYALPEGVSASPYLVDPIAAILAFHDSREWGRDLQIVCDLLRSNEGVPGTLNIGGKQALPIYFSNPDFVWSNEYPISRFAQGAFRICLESLYHELTGNRLQYTSFGKPMRATYEFGANALESYAASIGAPQSGFRKVYAIGDNPAADVAGANGYGWTSILVKTGVWDPELHGETGHGATYVVEDVEDGVKLLLDIEELL
ncbi:HAD-like domain-containing protein [Cladochytrium replicatum]|nr:HAD-like domain-containing protein [Cladochytrium replicatum]